MADQQPPPFTLAPALVGRGNLVNYSTRAGQHLYTSATSRLPYTFTGQEASLNKVRALTQRGLNYRDEPDQYDCPIIDSAYVTMPFQKGDDSSTTRNRKWNSTIGCLELCMFAEGSRHQEEIIVTGTKVRNGYEFSRILFFPC